MGVGGDDVWGDDIMILRFGGEIGSLGREIKVLGMNFEVWAGK